MRRLHAASAALLALLAAAPLAHSAQEPKRESLQALLERLRKQRDALVGELKASVDALLRSMEDAGTERDLDAMEAAKKRLQALGPEIAPLLLAHVDPGTQSTDAKKLTAMYVVDTLIELRTSAVTQGAIELAQQGSVEGRKNAIRILGSTPDAARAVPVLAGIYRGTPGDLGAAALAALAKIGGQESTKLLSEALDDARPEVVGPALEALASSRNESLAPRVLKLIANPNDGLSHLDHVVAYYRSVPQAVDKAVISALLRMAGEFSATIEQRCRVLDVLPSFSERIDADAKRELRAIAESPTKELREGALVALVQVGDKAARRELLTEYDDQIDQNKAWAGSYEARANVLSRIGDHREAINDYKKSIQLSQDDPRAKPHASYIGLARCYALTKKPQDAASTLRKAPLSAKQLEELAHDPAFAKMAEDPKYRDVFKTK